MTLEATKKVTREEFAEFIARPENADRLFELIDGEIVEKMPTGVHNWVAGILYAAIYNFLMSLPNLIGWVLTENRYQLSTDDHAVIPDVSFYRKREGRYLTTKGAAPFMPDFAIEIQSPDDSVPAMRRKAKYYLDRGTQIVWVVYPELELIEVYLGNDDVQFFRQDGVLELGELLPDFKYNVRDLWDTLKK